MRSFSGIAALLLSALLAGCGGGGAGNGEATPGTGNAAAEFAPEVAKSTQTAPPQTGSIRLAVSGAGGCGFDHVWVTVQAIRMYRTDAADSSASELTLSPPRGIDLVGLTGGLLAELGTADLPAGHYEALRLVLAENGPEGTPDAMANAVQVNGGGPTPLTTPAAARSGIKLPLKFDVAGQTADLVLRFDPCTSVVQAGKSGQYILKPMISARPRPQAFIAGPAQVVNTTTAGDQIDPHVAALANGGYVVVWTDWPAAGSSSSLAVIHGQRYDAAGNSVGGELLLYQGATAGGVTGLPGGGFAIAMLSGTGNVAVVLALQFDASGAPVGAAQTVLTAGTANYPMMANADDIDALPDGGYLATARVSNPRPPPNEAYHVRRFDASGVAVGDAIQVGGDFGIWPSVSTSVLSNGGWVTAFPQVFSPYAPRPHYNVQTFVRVFSGSGVLVAATDINANPEGDESSPSTAALKDGHYVVAWSVGPFTAGLSLPQIQLQLLDQSGTAASGVVDFDPPVNVGEPHLTALADGGFLLSFAQDEPSTPVLTVFGQYFDATGRASGSIFELGAARRPGASPNFLGGTWSVAATLDGGFVFTSERPGVDAAASVDVYESQFKPAAAL